jgi:hypothetical protein
MGPEGDEDRLQIREPVIVARSHKGLLITERKYRPRIARFVVRDGITACSPRLPDALRRRRAICPSTRPEDGWLFTHLVGSQEASRSFQMRPKPPRSAQALAPKESPPGAILPI